MTLKKMMPFILSAIFLNSTAGWSQETRPAIRESRYNYHDAFTNGFYATAVNEYRSAGGQPGRKYWQNSTNYRIEVSLDEKTDEIKGKATLLYKNNSPDALNFLWLYLEQNLFKSDSRGSAILAGDNNVPNANAPDFEGGIKVRSVKVVSAGNKKLPLNAKYIITDTRMQVWLPYELAPQTGNIQLEIEYAYTCPVNGAARTGIQPTKNGKIYSIAQWYPRMCVYDDISGWNTDPYTGSGEFYSNYGDFEISITVPASHTVLCSGELLNPSEVYNTAQIKRWMEARASDKTVIIRSKEEVESRGSHPGPASRTWKFRIKNARDAAWASSPAFIIAASRINLSSGKKSMAIAAYPVESDSAGRWVRSIEYIKGSIENYSNKWFEYPYPTAICIASNIGGQEYPGIEFCGWQRKGHGLWDVINHELGHNWFPMIVGSNERWYGWMDEGFDVFINGLSSVVFNNGEYKGGHTNMHLESDRFTNQKLEPIMSAAANMKKENMGTLLYFKPAEGLNLLREQVLGIERFDQAFKTYIHRWAFKHPTPDDFFRTMEDVSGEDLGWFWRSWFLHNWQLDQAIGEVKYINNDPSRGALITIDNLEKMPMPVNLELKTKSGKITRFKLPVEIWERNTSFTFKAPIIEELESVVIDPNKDLPDIDTLNNNWMAP